MCRSYKCFHPEAIFFPVLIQSLREYCHKVHDVLVIQHVTTPLPIKLNISEVKGNEQTKWIVAQLVLKYRALTESESSLPPFYKPAIGPYTVPI